LPKNGYFNYDCPGCQSSSPTAASEIKSVPSEEDKAPVANATVNTGFNNLNNLNMGHHSDSDKDSNLEFSFLFNNNLILISWILLKNQSTVAVFYNP